MALTAVETLRNPDGDIDLAARMSLPGFPDAALLPGKPRLSQKNASAFPSPFELTEMNKLIAFVALALATVLVSGCATSSSDTNPTTDAAKKDRTKSSLYAR
jgi:hypothetical protein